jgi:hypothetical protein
MKKYILGLLIIMLVISCGKRVQVIPEISNSLRDEVVLDLREEDSVIPHMITYNSEIIFITLKGKIFRFNPKQKMVNFLYDLITEIDTPIFAQENILVLKKNNQDTLILFDLQQMKVLKTVENIQTEKILGVNKDFICQVSKNQLVFYNHVSGKITETIDLGDTNEVLNSKASHYKGQILVLTTNNLFIFNGRQESLKSMELKYKACSGFLQKGKNIFYGSQSRHLVKLNIESNKIDWKFNLGDRLTVPPVAAESYVAVVPEDNNIYFFNKNGTLHWWTKLNSSRARGPIEMRENVGLFLWDNTFKFFNFKKKKVTTFLYPLPVYSDPIYINDYIFVISNSHQEDNLENDLKCITKIGNNYGVDVKIEPEKIIPVNKSIRFDLKEINLVKPKYNVKIIGPLGQSIYEKVISKKDDTSFIWIPKKANTYRLKVEIDAQNKQGLISETPISVIDLDRILSWYYYLLHKRSREDRFKRVPFE